MKRLLLIVALTLVSGCSPAPKGPSLDQIVKLSVLQQGGELRWVGSGVVLDEERVLTAKHCVVPGQLFVQLWTKDGWSDTFAVSDALLHDTLDIALLHVDLPEGTEGVSLATGEPQIYDEVFGYSAHQNVPTLAQIN